MLLAFEKVFSPSTNDSVMPATEGTASKLNVAVVFTDVPGTLAALRKAGALATRLGGSITLLAPQVVPFPLPLTSPPVLLDWSERRFQVITSESPVETRVRLYLCRDRWELLVQKLRPNSLVVLGSRKRWWPTTEARLGRRLRRLGHEVVMVESE